jgi:hypothetical protein
MKAFGVVTPKRAACSYWRLPPIGRLVDVLRQAYLQLIREQRYPSTPQQGKVGYESAFCVTPIRPEDVIRSSIHRRYHLQ